MFPSAPSEGGTASLGSTVQNLTRNFFGEGTRRWARTWRTWELGRIPRLEETLKQLDGFWCRRGLTWTRQERHRPRVLACHGLAQDSIRQETFVRGLHVRFLATSGKGFSGGSAFVQKRSPISAKKAANPVTDQSSQIEAVSPVTSFLLSTKSERGEEEEAFPHQEELPGSDLTQNAALGTEDSSDDVLRDVCDRGAGRLGDEPQGGHIKGELTERVHAVKGCPAGVVKVHQRARLPRRPRRGSRLLIQWGSLRRRC